MIGGMVGAALTLVLVFCGVIAAFAAFYGAAFVLQLLIRSVIDAVIARRRRVG